jgi:hypothetical protein
VSLVDALEAAGGSLLLHQVTRRAVKRDDGSLRATPDGEPAPFVQMDLEVGSVLLSPADCRQLGNKLFNLARQLEQP